jgi:predicted ribosome quality control (RQC) complex YloA/Tae2 family protein
VYSDSFQLEDLLQRLSEQARQQQTRTIQTLEDENRELRNKLSEVRQLWEAIYRDMQEVNNIAGQLSAIRKGAGRMMDRQKKMWIVNCTAI